jgi:predicted  nucleic acid-binding Zn-ribbon protein
VIEKLEQCPKCGEVKRWLYDAQLCATCGESEFDRLKKQKDALQDRNCFFCDLYRDAISETARTVDELAYWRLQAIWHRAAVTEIDRHPSEAQLARAEKELEEARHAENRERHAHAEAPRDPGGT